MPNGEDKDQLLQGKKTPIGIKYDDERSALDYATDSLKLKTDDQGKAWDVLPVGGGQYQVHRIDPFDPGEGLSNWPQVLAYADEIGANIGQAGAKGEEDSEVALWRNKFWIRDKKPSDTTTPSFSSPYVDPADGALKMVNRNATAEERAANQHIVVLSGGEKSMSADEARAAILSGSNILGRTSLADGSTLEFISTDGDIKVYRSDAKEEDFDPLKDTIPVEGQGKFYKTSASGYTFVPDVPDPFVPQRGGMPVPGGHLIQTSANQWQFVRQTYQADIWEDPESGRRFQRDTSGNWGPEVKPMYDPELTRVDGINLLQQRSGDMNVVPTPTLDNIITQALIDGDVEKALAFQDFRDRPTAQEAMQTALEYARSPADQQVISSLARGETPVREPDAGVIQRVGPRPDFLVQAYQDFQRRTQTGRAPTEEEAQQLTERYATGQSPTSDKLKIEKQTLEARLEKIALDTEITREKHQAEMSQRQELHNTKIRELTQKVNNAQEKARLEQEYIENQRYGNGGNGGGAATGNGTRTRSGSQPDNTLADANISYDSSTRAITVEDENGVETTFKNIDELMKAATGETDLYNVIHPSRDTGTGTNYDTGRALQVLKTQGLRQAIIYTQNEMQRAKETMYADVGGPWGAQIPWNHWAITARDEEGNLLYGPSEEGLKNFQDDAAKAGITDLYQAGRQFKSPDDLSMQARAAQDPGRFEDIQAGPTAAETFEKAIADMQKQRSFEDEYTAPSGPITSISGPRSIRSRSSVAGDTDVGDASLDFASTTTYGKGPGEDQSLPTRDRGPARETASLSFDEQENEGFFFAKGGITRGDNLEVVGEEGPELVDLPPGTHVIPFQQLNQRQMLDLKRKGVRGYQSGGIVFDDNQTQTATLPFGLRQMQAGRPITPSRGYLSQQAGLRLPSAQAFQNITPESREVFLDLAAQAGIPRKSFAQELALTVPSGRRLPVARIAPTQRRAIQ